MPFKDTLAKKYNNYPSVDLAVVILEENSWYPKELLSVIEIKHYDKFSNSEGIKNDMAKLMALKKGVYYAYSKRKKKLRARRAYFLYLVDKRKGKIIFDPKLKRKIEVLRENGYLKAFLGYGDKGEFIIQGCDDP
jgi:hypothetical protein